jgi:hypothetical protein
MDIFGVVADVRREKIFDYVCSIHNSAWETARNS